MQDDISAIKESKTKWQRVSSLADASAIKVAGLKKNSNRLDESEAELADLKKQTEAAALELGTNLNTFSAKRRLAILDSMCRWLELQKTYLDEYQSLIKDCLPELALARSEIKAYTEEIPNAVKRIPSLVLKDTSISGYLQGYLYRKTKMNFTRKSYFVLENGVLSCYENLDSAEPKWKLDMLTCTVKPSSEATRNFVFDIISPTKCRTLQADSQETMQKWITAIQEAISSQLDKQRIGKPGRRGSNATALKSSADASAEVSKREAVIQSLYEAEEQNRKCADCSEANPTWISINLGILICLECSGIHRSMGTHISKVRSLTLDSLPHETKSFIMALGNRKSNEIFGPDVLTAIPNCFGERLHPLSTRKDREAWIKAKYAEKIFVETYRGQNIQLDFVAAIRQHDLPRCVLLYSQGANLNFKYEMNHNRQPLHYAADGDNPLVLHFLLQNGASVNAKDANGLTPLHIAASGHVTCAAMLCKMRAKVEVTDSHGKTPLDYAMEAQNADVITLLRLAKLSRESGNENDEKSFSDALDAFMLDLQKSTKHRPLNGSGSISANGLAGTGQSANQDSASSVSDSSSGSNNPSSKKQKHSSSNASAQPIAIPAHSHHHSHSHSHHSHHSTPSPSLSPLNSHSPNTQLSVSASPDALSPSPVTSTSKSSFSFLSKLDTKRR